MQNQLSCFLYTSATSTDCPLTEVAQIVKQARQINATMGITGVLLFDGEYFAQYVEGPTANIDVLADKLKADHRHDQFAMRAQEQGADSRRFRSWSMGFADVDRADIDLIALGKLSADEALEYFERSVSEMDVL